MNKNNTNAVPLNTTTFNTRLLNTTKLNTIGFPVLSKRSGSSADISQAIMDSLVCWYDPGKQQCTNESMAANPVLADLSGNGHDIECSNFAWSGMSGIGGYAFDAGNLSTLAQYGDAISIVGNKITLNSKPQGVISGNIFAIAISVLGEAGQSVSLNIPAFKIKVSGLPDGTTLSYNYSISTNSKTSYKWLGDKSFGNGITEIPAINTTLTPDSETDYCYCNPCRLTFGTLTNEESFSDITIEILPEYPNALVSDGVDDYCYTDGLPILTDYTVIAKRKILADKVSALASKATDNNSTDGAFIFDAKNGGRYIACNFGANNALVELYPEDVSYQTKESYNGSPIIKLNYTDTDKLSLFTFSAQNNLVSQYALYSFLLFDRTLTTEEIEWVKQNMIESGGVLKTNWSDSSLWSFYNEDNQNRINGTVSSNRMVITANGKSEIIPITGLFMEVIIENAQIPAYNIKVTGLKNGITLQYKDVDTATYLYFNEDGIYTIPAHNTNSRWYGFSFNKKFENENIVIQQLLS